MSHLVKRKITFIASNEGGDRYFRGKKISPVVIRSIIKDLLEEEKTKREQEEFGKDEKGNQ